MTAFYPAAVLKVAPQMTHREERREAARAN